MNNLYLLPNKIAFAFIRKIEGDAIRNGNTLVVGNVSLQSTTDQEDKKQVKL